jgi:hypothetical protein
MKIEVQDILDLLPIVADRGWVITDRPFNTIRDRDGRCPICAFLNETHGLNYRWEMKLAWGESNLPRTAAIKRIAYAADYPDDPLRPALMQALGMTPEATVESAGDWDES